MVKVFILVVMTHPFNGGITVAFSEFTSLKSCKENAAYLSRSPYIKTAYCTEK